jgi:NADH:ubiquinone oxidoreductase subunit 3 (subunit A)
MEDGGWRIDNLLFSICYFLFAILLFVIDIEMPSFANGASIENKK